MKKSILIVLLIAAVIVLETSCDNYEAKKQSQNINQEEQIYKNPYPEDFDSSIFKGPNDVSDISDIELEEFLEEMHDMDGSTDYN